MKKIIITKQQAKLLKSLNENVDTINNNFSTAFKKEPSKTFKPNMNDNKGKKFNPLTENKDFGKFGGEIIKVLKEIIVNGSNVELPEFFKEKFNLTKDSLCNLLINVGLINDEYKVLKADIINKLRNLYSELNTNHVQNKEVMSVDEEDNGSDKKTHTTKPIDPNYKPLEVIHHNREICILKDDKSKLFVYYYVDKSKDDFKPYVAIDYHYVGKNSVDNEPEYEYDEDWEIDNTVLGRYVNDNLANLTKGKGLKSFEQGKDLVLIDDALKTELLSLYDKDKGLVTVLGGISEDTTAASSGSFLAPMSFDNKEFSQDDVIKRDIIEDNNKFNSERYKEVEKKMYELKIAGKVNSPEYQALVKERSLLEKQKSKDIVDETTDSSSSGQYSQPAIWAKDSNNARFSHKPVYPKGKIVKVSENFIYSQIAKKLNKSVDEVKNIIKEQKIPLNKLPKLLKLVENKSKKALNEVNLNQIHNLHKKYDKDYDDKFNLNNLKENGNDLKKVRINGVDFYADEMKRMIYTDENLKNKISWDRLNSHERQQIYDQLKTPLKENGQDLKTQTTYKGGEMISFDNCIKLNNNKKAENGKCSVGAVDKVVKGTKTKDSLLKENDKNLPLKYRIKSTFPSMKDTDFDRHESDLYVKYTPELDKWLKQNYEFYSNIEKFKSQTDNQIWLDIPFAEFHEKYDKNKKVKDVNYDYSLNENTKLSPQQTEQLKRINLMSLDEFISFLNRWDITPENMQPQFIQSNWGDKITYDWDNSRWLPVSDGEAQGGLAFQAQDNAAQFSEDKIYEQVAKQTGKSIEEVKKIIKLNEDKNPIVNKYLVTREFPYEGKDTWTVFAVTPDEAKDYVVADTGINKERLSYELLKQNLRGTKFKGIHKRSAY